MVSIIGIIAAMALPQFKLYMEQAKEATAKDNLRVVRNTIELYASRHGGVPPGYPNDNPSSSPGWTTFWAQIIRDGKYFPSLPENPFNESRIIYMIPNSGDFPAEATGRYGWIYKPATKNFRIDWPGEDSEGVRFFDY